MATYVKLSTFDFFPSFSHVWCNVFVLFFSQVAINLLHQCILLQQLLFCNFINYHSSPIQILSLDLSTSIYPTSHIYAHHSLPTAPPFSSMPCLHPVLVIGNPFSLVYLTNPSVNCNWVELCCLYYFQNPLLQS